MDNRQGSTVTPQLYVDENGIERLSYEHAHVFNNATRLAAQAEALGNQQNYFSQDTEGNIEHQWDFQEGNEELVNYIHGESDEYDSEEFEEDDDGVEVDDDFIEHIYENLISEEDYDTVIEWAGENLSDDLVDQFDDIMDSGDEDDIWNAIEKLIDIYNEYA